MEGVRKEKVSNYGKGTGTNNATTTNTFGTMWCGLCGEYVTPSSGVCRNRMEGMMGKLETGTEGITTYSEVWEADTGSSRPQLVAQAETKELERFNKMKVCSDVERDAAASSRYMDASQRRYIWRHEVFGVGLWFKSSLTYSERQSCCQ